MVDIMDRRVTRSLSNELQARAAAQATQQSASNAYLYQSGNHMNFQQQEQHNSSIGQSQQQELSSSIANHQHQSFGGMNEGMGGSMGGRDPAYPRTTSDELFLNTLMNTPLSPGTSTMEAASLGFLDSLQSQPAIRQAQRGDSEELFSSWIATSTPEISNLYQNNVYSTPSSMGNRLRQPSRRPSSELQAIIAQQSGTSWTPRADHMDQAYLQTNTYLSGEIMCNVNSNQKQYRTNLSEDKSGHSEFSNLGSLKSTWFSATSPMTRSRSSELRRRYAQLDGLQSLSPADVFQKLATQGTLEGLVNASMTLMGTNERLQNDSDSKMMGPQVPRVPTMSSSPPLQNRQQIQQHPPAATSSLADVVGLLKGSLERKKLQTKQQQRAHHQKVIHQQQESQQRVRNGPTPMSSPQVSARQDESLKRPQDLKQQLLGDNGLVQLGQVLQANLLRAHSPDASSGGPPSHSAGLATSDGPSNSAMSVHRQVLKRGNTAVDQPSPKRQSFGGMDSGHNNGDSYENGVTKTDMPKKPDQLTRASSITSSLRTGFHMKEIDGATRKRRVERQRKMAEAKGRGSAPPMPADMQAAVKRCDTLEKEVRSLKLNLSFMNRKDSEQTKKIEELEQQNEDLKEERDRLLEELERVSGVHDPQ